MSVGLVSFLLFPVPHENSGSRTSELFAADVFIIPSQFISIVTQETAAEYHTLYTFEYVLEMR